MKKFTRSSNDDMVAGVCAGIAEYFEIDVTLVRVAFVFATLFWFIPLVLYIVIAFVAPKGE